MHINNGLTDTERKFLEFFVNHSKYPKEIIFEQIRQADIIKDITEFHLIFEFKYSNTPAILLDNIINLDYVLQILHNDGRSPTVFIMFIENGVVTGCEVFNGDYRPINDDDLCDGEIIHSQHN